MKHRLTTLIAALCAFLAVIVASVGSASISGVARADPLANAKKQAAALQVQVTQLQLRVELASEKFDGAQADLAQLINAQEQATRVATAATVAAQNARAAAESSTRALYMSGGITGLYATVLTGENPGTLLDGLHSVQVVSDAAAASLSHVDSAVQSAADADANVAALRTRQDTLTAQAATASADAESALAQEQAILDNTNAEVVALEAQLQIQIDEQNAARDAATLAAAQHAALVAGGAPQVRQVRWLKQRSMLRAPSLESPMSTAVQVLTAGIAPVSRNGRSRRPASCCHVRPPTSTQPYRRRFSSAISNLVICCSGRPTSTIRRRFTTSRSIWVPARCSLLHTRATSSRSSPSTSMATSEPFGSADGNSMAT